MPATIRALDRAAHASVQLRLRIGDELRDARALAGTSQRQIAEALKCSGATISRVERGLRRDLSLDFLARHAAVVGLVARVNLYPTGLPIRDAGQLRVLNRLQLHVAASFRWVLEFAVGPDDLRAFDAALLRPEVRIGIDAWSRIRDVQASARATMRKQVDSGVHRVIIVLADTKANHDAVREAGDALRRAFPLTTRQTLAALREGRDPGGNGIVFI